VTALPATGTRLFVPHYRRTTTRPGRTRASHSTSPDSDPDIPRATVTDSDSDRSLNGLINEYTHAAAW